MKKLFSLLFACLFLGGLLAACGNTGGTTAPADNAEAPALSVVTTIYPQYDIIRALAGERVELTMLLSPGAEVHSYDPSPRDIITIQNCDVFIYVGGESDSWADTILGSMDTSNMEIVSLMDLVDVVEEEIKEGMQGEDDHDDEDHDDDEEAEYDEHVWTSPKNAQILVAAFAGILSERDPDGAAQYNAAAAEYLAALDELDAAFREVVAASSQSTLIVGDRFPFRYLVEEYGLDYYAAFPGCSTESDASASTIAFLIDKTEALNASTVFYIEFSNEKIADTLCEATGAEKRLLHSCHNVTKDQIDSQTGYLDLMWENVETLREALQ